tara:strand:- start:2058 stop:2303 length:246 start_codon:yes stop_codon:yes gene_type:complete
MMAILNIWSIGHFLQWFVVARYVFRNWYLFFLLSLGWEIIELFLPYEFAKETFENKISDILVNFLGYFLGNYLWEIKNKNF